jgi:haloalkane dehalogenase
VGELVSHLGLLDFVVMGQDWGGPVGTAVAVGRADRVRGLLLGNSWFWPADSLSVKLDSDLVGVAPDAAQRAKYAEAQYG